MADISKISDGTQIFNVKDDYARAIAEMSSNQMFGGTIINTEPLSVTCNKNMGQITYLRIDGYTKNKVSVGQSGEVILTFTDKNNTKTNSVTFTTGMPLMSCTGAMDVLYAHKGIVEKRCYFDQDEQKVKPLDTPIILKLSEKEFDDYCKLTGYGVGTIITRQYTCDVVIWFLLQNNNGISSQYINETTQAKIDRATIQVSNIPEASEYELGNIYQYTGQTSDNYVRGYFYVCELIDGQYVWNPIDFGNPDLSNYIQKSSTTGLLKNDGTVDTNSYITSHQDISGKADKVTSATSGNFAGLNASGNITDSGKKASDFATTAQGTKADTAVQTIQIGGVEQTKTDGTVNLPTYPTTLPASNTTDTYSETGTEPVSGKAVAEAIGTLHAAATSDKNFVTKISFDETSYGDRNVRLTQTALAKNGMTMVAQEEIMCLATRNHISDAISKLDSSATAPDGKSLKSINIVNGKISGYTYADIPTTLPASDVSDWAKAATKPTYTADEIGLGNVVNTGDSATPVENGTTKFTTGGAYTELNKKVDKEEGKGLSSNDFTDDDKTAILNSPITSTSTTSPITDSADGMVQGLTIYGRSEVVDGEIKSVGEGYAVVDLGALDWERQKTQQSGIYRFKGTVLSPLCIYNDEIIQGVCARYQADTLNKLYYGQADNLRLGVSNDRVYIRDDNYTDATAFKNSLNRVMLCYQLADPSQGNAIAVKTDNGTGNNGTMATFTTALPLRSTLDGVTRDELIIGNGKAEVVTRCEVVDDNIVPLATPVTTPLTSSEIAQFNALRTYDPTTAVSINDSPDFEVKAYAGTANGKAVQELESRIKSEFDELKKDSEHFVYAFYIDHNDTNPATCVHPYMSKYGCDNYFYIPAKMNYTTGTFDYGSWRDFVYRIAKPCMVAYNGHVDYYLDPDDYSSKIDGYGVSDIDDMSYAGNVMVELDCLYFKRWKANNKSYVVISDQKLDKSFKAYAHHDKNGKVLPYIYLAAYNGSYDGTRLRSISDIEYHNLNALTINKIMSNTTRQQEMDFAMANNVQGEAGEGWFIRHKADWDYINTLLILISMNTNTQATFGNGNISSYVSTSNTGILTTGTMNDKGLFYGKNDNVSGVKVFGIENWWGNIWVSIAGWNLVNGGQKIKMSYDQSDVSSVDGFNVTDGTGFATVSNSTPSGTSGGYISDWTIGDFGLIPTVASGASDKRLCDGLWFNNSANCFALCGGGSRRSVLCGAFCASLSDSASVADWNIGAALSYKPLSA